MPHDLVTPARITLLTDFGTADGYVAAMKGVIASIAPAAVVDDAAHDIPPGDIQAAAWALQCYWRLYPPGTTHVVVVDPGVGSDRRALAARVHGRMFVAPDNGVLTRVLEDAPAEAIVAVENRAFLRDEISATFHGRDVFAPAAGHLAAGVSVGALGPAVDDPVKWPIPTAARTDTGVRGRVVHVDRFGNLITNIPGEWVRGAAGVSLGGEHDFIPLGRTYSDAAPDRPLALIGSSGLLEISVRDGSAVDRLGLGRGAEVETVSS